MVGGSWRECSPIGVRVLTSYLNCDTVTSCQPGTLRKSVLMAVLRLPDSWAKVWDALSSRAGVQPRFSSSRSRRIASPPGWFQNVLNTVAYNSAPTLSSRSPGSSSSSDSPDCSAPSSSSCARIRLQTKPSKQLALVYIVQQLPSRSTRLR